MILHSTNGESPKVSFPEAISNGIAPDGGLYMPDKLPRLPQALFRNIGEMSVRDVGFVVMNTLLGDMIPSYRLKSIVDDALNFEMPLKKIDDSHYVLELFHGPTNTFKDVGARLMARLLPEIAPVGSCANRHVVMATSGDSGAAVANAFSGSENTIVYVLFPKGVLKPAVVSRFASFGNVRAVEVNGTFDECQSIVKDVLRDDATTGARRLTSGNSINAARELPSTICFFYAYAKAVADSGRKDNIVISVPCGNLGGLAAALISKQMGLPVSRFIAANNSNDTFVEYLKTGGFTPKKALLTLARAMDVGNPSNLTRIIDLYNGNLELLRKDVEGYAYSDAEISETMRSLINESGIEIDPQGATAFRALQRHLREGEIGVAMASGHPGNYRSEFIAATGNAPRSGIDGATGLTSAKVLHIPATVGALKRLLSQI